MAFESPTLEETIEIEKAQIRAKIPGADTSDGSDYDINARAHATVARGIHAHADYLVRQALPTTCEADFLAEQCRIRNITRQAAAKATGYLLLTSTTNGDIQATASAITHADGTAYTTTGAGTTATATLTGKTVGDGATLQRIPVIGTVSTFAADMPITIGSEVAVVKDVLTNIDAIDLWVPLAAIPTAGTAIAGQCGIVVPFQATTAAAAGEKSTDETLTLTSPVGDISATAIILECGGGGDEETDAELRGRLLDWFADRPGSGNLADYRDWARTTPDVRLDDAFIYPGLSGLGTVVVVPFGVTGARNIGSTANGLVSTQLAAKASFMDSIVLYPYVDTSPTDVTLALPIKPGLGYEPDHAVTFSTHGSTACTTTRLYFTGSVTGIEVGDRVVVPLTNGGITRCYQRTATNITVTYIDLDTALPSAPAVSVSCTPGGPLWQPVQDAIDALLDSLGPGDTPIPSRYPSPAVAFPDVLHSSDVVKSAMGVAGVIDVIPTSSPAFGSTGIVPAILGRVRCTSLVISWV